MQINNIHGGKGGKKGENEMGFTPTYSHPSRRTGSVAVS